MKRSRFSALVMGLSIAAIAGSVLSLEGCTYVDPAGREHTLKPAERTPANPGWRVISRFTDPDTGDVYELIDTDGDGKVDLIRRVRDGRLLQPENPFTPIQPTQPQQPTNPSKPTGTPTQRPAQGSFGTLGGDGDDGSNYSKRSPNWLLNYIRQGFAEIDATTANWEPFNFGGLTAEQWIGNLGLNVAPGTEITTDNVRMPIVEYNGGNDGYNETVIMWSSQFDMPRISARGLEYRMDTLRGASGVTFVVIRAHGSANEIIRALAEIGSERLSYDGGAGERWSFERSGDVCNVSIDGTQVWSIPLD